MKIIINAEPDDMPAVVQLIMDKKPMFDRSDDRLGWGWMFAVPGGKRFFLRRIKGGISANPAKDVI